MHPVDAFADARFPGGSATIEHWENWLLTDCTGRGPMSADLVHPVAMFHVPIRGSGTSIAELFALFGTSAAEGRVGLLGYDWVYDEPLREEIAYDVRGGVVRVDRRESTDGSIGDDIDFAIELSTAGRRVATATSRWHVRRHGPGRRNAPLSVPNGVPTGASITPWEMASVDPARMKTMAAILRDPYPVHWDRELNEALGLGHRTVNQGPLNVSYIANMLMAWAGDDAIRRLDITFGHPVFEGDRLLAGGRVIARDGAIAHCEVWLDRGDERVVEGRAAVVAPRGEPVVS